MRSPSWQVHGLLHVVQGRRGAQGRQRRHRHNQDQEDDPVRGLVSHRVQGWNQLPAANRCARGRSCQGPQVTCSVANIRGLSRG